MYWLIHSTEGDDSCEKVVLLPISEKYKYQQRDADIDTRMVRLRR